MNTAIHTDETGLVIEYEQQRSMDTQLPGIVNIMLLTAWLLICAAGGVLMVRMKKRF